MSFETDTIQIIYDEIAELEKRIIASGESIRVLGDRESNAAAVYENCKNKYLIELFAQENEDKTLKRTEAARSALYRSLFAQERLERGLAANALRAERDYLNALQSAQMAKQSRLKVLTWERESKF